MLCSVVMAQTKTISFENVNVVPMNIDTIIPNQRVIIANGKILKIEPASKTIANNGSSYHPGDGGMVAVFHDASQNVIATTGSEWKAQTFYTSPIQDLSCPTEDGTTRSTANCATADASDGSGFYGLHWEVPETWMNTDFDDSDWPSATTYTNATIGVDNKPSYTNYTDIFDDATNDAEFIWSTNVILDNEVIVRYTVD